MNLPDRLSALVADATVEDNADTAIRILQKTIGTVQDGILTQNMAAGIKKADQDSLCALYLANRALRYTGMRNFDTEGREWLQRLFLLAQGV